MSEEKKRSNGDLVKSASSKSSPDTSPELPLKHPLEHRWSLWFYKNDRNRGWEENLLEISSFDTVEDFWALYNYVELPSKLPPGCDYSLFKTGIKPMWEDSHNKQGGRWLFNLNKNQGATDVDTFWLEILLCLIGEGFDELGADVCGTVVQIRPKIDKIGVWTADYRSADGNIKIGRTLKRRLNMHPRNLVQYQAHADTQAKTGSSTRARYVV